MSFATTITKLVSKGLKASVSALAKAEATHAAEAAKHALAAVAHQEAAKVARAKAVAASKLRVNLNNLLD